MSDIFLDEKLLKDLESIIKSKRGYITRKPYDERVVFIASGGLDSTTCMGLLIEKYNSIIYPLFVRRHSKAMPYEEAAFDKITEYYLNKYPQNFMKPKKIEIEVPPVDFKVGLTERRLDTTGHVLRNSVLQSLGVQYAVHLNDSQNYNISSVFAGSIADDSFPHNFLEAFRIITLQTCWDLQDWNWQVTSPFIDPYLEEIPEYKKDVIKWAYKIGVPIEYTRTCTLGEPISCGICGDCLKRRKAFKDAGYEDPLEYKFNEGEKE